MLILRIRAAATALLLSVIALAVPAAADCNDPFADPSQLLEFHLRMTSETWAAFQASDLEPEAGTTASDAGGVALGSDCEAQYPYFAAEFRCGEQEPWLSVGFRRKRDRTQSTFKLPIKLDFNRFVDGQRWPAARGDLGFRRLTLNSGQPDEAVRTGGGFGGNAEGSPPGVLSALLTEHLAWRLMKEELPESSGSAYARLSVHLTDSAETHYAGLYILIEDIDRTTVRARYGVDLGALYKTTDAECPESAVFEDPPPNPATDGFTAWLALDPAAFAGTWYERTDEVMDLDGLLRQEALRELLANTEDTILGRMNNYFALDLQGRKRVYLPWDLDDMFRPEPQAHPADTPLVSSCVGNGNTCSTIPLGVNIRDQAELRPRYLEVLCRLTNGVSEEQRLVAQLTALDTWLRPLIAPEVPVLWEPRDEDPLDASTPGTYASEVERMKEWIPARVAAVRQMIEAEGVACSHGCEAGASVPCTWFGLPSSRMCESGVWGACAPLPEQVPALTPPPAPTTGAPDSTTPAVPPLPSATDPLTPTPTVGVPDSMAHAPSALPSATDPLGPTPSPTAESPPDGSEEPGNNVATNGAGCGCRLNTRSGAANSGLLAAGIALMVLRRGRRSYPSIRNSPLSAALSVLPQRTDLLKSVRLPGTDSG